MATEEKKLLSIRVPPDAAKDLAKQALDHGIECGPWCAQILTTFSKVPPECVHEALAGVRIAARPLAPKSK